MRLCREKDMGFIAMKALSGGLIRDARIKELVMVKTVGSRKINANPRAMVKRIRVLVILLKRFFIRNILSFLF